MVERAKSGGDRLQIVRRRGHASIFFRLRERIKASTSTHAILGRLLGPTEDV